MYQNNHATQALFSNPAVFHAPLWIQGVIHAETVNLNTLKRSTSHTLKRSTLFLYIRTYISL